MKKKRIFLMICSLICCLAVLAGCQNADEEKEKTQVVLTTGFAEGEVFRIGKASCSLAEAQVYLTNTKNQYESVYGPDIWETAAQNETLEDRVKDTVIARIAQIKTMNLLAAEYNITLTKEEQATVDKAAAQYFSSLNQTEIDEMGISSETIEGLYGEYALANKVYDSIVADVNPEISDDEARTITVKQILIKTYSLNSEGEKIKYDESDYAKAKETAETVCTRAKNGEDFDALAGEFNEDSKTTYSFGIGEMDSNFEKAAFNLGTNEISDVVETEYGFHIIQCVSTFDRKETDANKVKIVKKRKEEAFNKVYDTFVGTLVKNLNEKLWDSVKFIDNEQVKTDTFFDVYNQYFEK